MPIIVRLAQALGQMTFRFNRIAGIAFFVGLVAAGVMLAPFALDAIRAPDSEHVAETNVLEAGASRFYVEEHLVGLGKEPLAWGCRSGQPDRVRFFRSSCFAEHILEFERIGAGGDGTLQLTTREDAVFLSEGGTKLLGRQQLSASRSDSLVSMLSRRLPRMTPHVDSWSMPQYQSAIETCISGEAHLVVRNSFDQEYENLVGDMSSLAGVKLSTSPPGICK